MNHEYIHDRPYDATQAYAVSKLANVLHTRELAARLQETGADVTVNCVHPGIVRTRLNRDREGVLTDLVFFLLSKLLKTIPQVPLINQRLLMPSPPNPISFKLAYTRGAMCSVPCSPSLCLQQQLLLSGSLQPAVHAA